MAGPHFAAGLRRPVLGPATRLGGLSYGQNFPGFPAEQQVPPEGHFGPPLADPPSGHLEKQKGHQKSQSRADTTARFAHTSAIMDDDDCYAPTFLERLLAQPARSLVGRTTETKGISSSERWPSGIRSSPVAGESRATIGEAVLFGNRKIYCTGNYRK
jgi:hypothetical protein